MTPEDGEASGEEEELMDPTIPGRETAGDGAGVSSRKVIQGMEGTNDSLHRYIVLKDSKAQLKRGIFMTL